MLNKVLESKKYQRGPQKMKKNVFLKKGPSYILSKIIYGISEPHGDLSLKSSVVGKTKNLMLFDPSQEQ